MSLSQPYTYVWTRSKYPEKERKRLISNSIFPGFYFGKNTENYFFWGYFIQKYFSLPFFFFLFL